MTLNRSDFYVFKTHAEAESAIRALSQVDFDVKKLSLVGKGYHTEEHPIGFYRLGDKVKSWGAMGALWGTVWGLLITPAFFFLPGLGLVALAGPLVAMLVSALEGAVLVGGVSALGAALLNMGVNKDQVIQYETALKADEYLLMVHGSSEDIDTVRSVLKDASHSG
ncbi:hypothetical protein NJH78_23710 [Pseudomonas chlororaphis]|uniref:hypothetical protein n=1 Tax=Pseudomonas chlororaphis TaxID=587753 RepID=UPI00209B302D|nr:hypothetical protein [Pseudomonas chlororaphis]MCO7573002.1 hypothetical protein [Pseudomonas chlororaphis]MCO7591408.1 hypothetical protein [Pseudomonas chlororaphis]